MPKLNFSYDEANDILIVENLRYAGELFRRLAFSDVGSRVCIAERQDGALTLMTIPKPEVAVFPHAR